MGNRPTRWLSPVGPIGFFGVAEPVAETSAHKNPQRTNILHNLIDRCFAMWELFSNVRFELIRNVRFPP